jgi:hypothetical protein
MPCLAEKVGKMISTCLFCPYLLLLGFERSKLITMWIKTFWNCLLNGMLINWILENMLFGMDCFFIRADFI